MKQIFYSLCLFLLMMQGAFASELTESPDLEKISYILVKKTRITQNVFEYTYQMEVTNKTTAKLKKLTFLFPPDQYSQGGIKITDAFVTFDILEKGETKISKDTFSFQYFRLNAPLNVETFESMIFYNKGISFKDAKNNEVTLFIDRLYETDNKKFSDILTISENKNPTNKDLNTFPAITQNFIEFNFSENFSVNHFNTKLISAAYGLQQPKDLNIEIKYVENPYRTLLFRDHRTEWAAFTNHQDTGIAELKTIPENNQIVFALIRSNNE